MLGLSFCLIWVKNGKKLILVSLKVTIDNNIISVFLITKMLFKEFLIWAFWNKKYFSYQSPFCQFSFP